MIVPFSVTDFIERAAAVYGERVGVVDEPDQPAESLGRLTYAEVHELSRRQAAKLDELGIEVGERVNLPDDLIPADARVEIDAKTAAGYFTPGPIPDAAQLRDTVGRGLQ